MHVVHPFDRLANLFGRPKRVGGVNAPYHQHAVLGFNLAANLGDQPAVAGVDLTRLQRASEGAEQSATGGGNQIVDGRGVGR